MSNDPAQGSGTEGTKADSQATNSAQETCACCASPTTSCAQGSGTCAACRTTQKPPNPYSMSILKRMAKRRRKPDGKFPVASIFLGFAIGAPIMLVGLPLGALLIVQTSGCCTNESTEQLISFWGSVLGGMLALFGVMITAVFVITTFRIDKNARAEAAIEAADAAGKFLLDYKRELMDEIDQDMREVKCKKKQAIKCMTAAKCAVKGEKKEATKCINAAKTDTESASEKAVAAIEKVRENVAGEGAEATKAIDQATDDVGGRRAAAIEEIDAEVAGVERAAAEAKARIQAQPDDSPSGDSQD